MILSFRDEVVLKDSLKTFNHKTKGVGEGIQLVQLVGTTEDTIF